MKLIKSMKGKKSCGLDWLWGYSLKLAAKDLVPELKPSKNTSIRTGRFYSEASKLTERAVHEQIYEYDLLHPDHHDLSNTIQHRLPSSSL